MSINDLINQPESKSEIWTSMLLGLVAAVVAPTILFPTIMFLSMMFTIPTISIYDVFIIEIMMVVVIIVTLFVALFHVVLLGIPSVMIAWRYKFIHWWTCLIAGFLLGCLPTAIVLSVDSNLIEKIQQLLGGALTRFDWASFGHSILTMGFYGTVGGLAFWVIWQIRIRRAIKNNIRVTA